MYRGEHHPTDVLGSLLLAALWLTAASVLIRPNADARAQTRPTAPDAPREPDGAAVSPGSSPGRRP
jgi:undecaprenyl-diphosphatase